MQHMIDGKVYIEEGRPLCGICQGQKSYTQFLAEVIWGRQVF